MELTTSIAGDATDTMSTSSNLAASLSLGLFTPSVPTTSSDLEDITGIFTTTSTGKPTAFTEILSEEEGDHSLVTVFTVNNQGSNKPSVTFIAPTITTNSLPTGLSNASVPTFYFNASGTSTELSSTYSSLYYNSSSYPYSSFASLTPISSKSRTTSSIPRSSKNLSSYSRPTITSPTLRTSTTTPTTSKTSKTSARGTVTITEFLEEVTYTQAYVITDSRTTLTTAFLATTSFYINSLTSTYSISPAAITTDINALKSRLDFDELFEKHTLSKGAIVGISVGVVLAFLSLVGFLTYYLMKKGKFKSKFWNKEENYDDNYDTEEEDISIFQNVNNGNHNSHANAPPIPNRQNKPTIQFTNSSSDINNGISSLNEEYDLGLFDMKSTLSSIGSDNKLLPPTPMPQARRNKGINSIDKLNHTVPDTPSTPISKLAYDRTMGVLYESPNEHAVWDEFEAAKTLGLMSDHLVSSPVRRNPDKFSTYSQQLNEGSSDNENDDSFKNSLFVPRVRSGSGATRYEYLSNNVESFKQELRLSSPLRTKFEFEDPSIFTTKDVPPIPAARKTHQQ